MHMHSKTRDTPSYTVGAVDFKRYERIDEHEVL